VAQRARSSIRPAEVAEGMPSRSWAILKGNDRSTASEAILTRVPAAAPGHAAVAELRRLHRCDRISFGYQMPASTAEHNVAKLGGVFCRKSRDAEAARIAALECDSIDM